MIRQTRFGFPARQYRQPESRVTMFEPTLGFDGGQAPTELYPGFTPESQSWMHKGGYIQPRSGISRYDATFALGDAALYGMEAFDIQARRHAIIASAGTVAMMATGGASFSNLSWVAAGGASDQTPSADFEHQWDGAAVYEPARDQNIVVLTNNRQLPKFLNVLDSTTTYSDFTWVASHFSRAKSVCEHDYRLVWFNVSSSTLSFPVRVQWSARGNPVDMTIANGGGFEDLMDMRGNGQRVVADRDSIVLFTDEQIWRGRKRGDAYAYDFYCVNRELGCPYPRTIHGTPQGIVFMARDLEMYLLAGDETVPLGPTHRKGPEQGDHSRIQLCLQNTLANGDLAFALYNSQDNRSELYYTSNETNANLWPQNRLDYNWANQSFFFSRFSHELTCGFEMQDVEESVTWDSIPYTWEQYNVPWDSPGLGAPARRVVVVSSNGTPYRFRSDQTSDDGSAIDARWRSHALSQDDAFRFDQLHEIWLEHASNSTATINIHTTGNLGRSFVDTHTRVLSASSGSAEMIPVWFTAQNPMFELRVNDGSVPRISRMMARLRDAGQWNG